MGGDQAGEHSSSTRIAVSSGGLEILSPNSPGETEVQGNQTSEVHDVRRCARAILTDDIGHEAITPGTGSTLVSSDETLADTDDHRLFKGYHEESDTVHRKWKAATLSQSRRTVPHTSPLTYSLRLPPCVRVFRPGSRCEHVPRTTRKTSTR